MTKIKYDISLIFAVPLQEGFNERPSKIPPPHELWTTPGYLFILKENIGHQKDKFAPVKLTDKILGVFRVLELTSRSLIESQVEMCDRGMGNGKLGNVVLIPSVTWGIGRAEDRHLFVKAKCWVFYFPHLLVESPSAEECNWICDGSLAPAIAKGRWSLFFFFNLFSGTLQESALNLKRINWKLGGNLKELVFSGNLKESVLREKHLSVELLQLMEDKKHEHWTGFSCVNFDTVLLASVLFH